MSLSKILESYSGVDSDAEEELVSTVPEKFTSIRDWFQCPFCPGNIIFKESKDLIRHVSYNFSNFGSFFRSLFCSVV